MRFQIATLSLFIAVAASSGVARAASVPVPAPLQSPVGVVQSKLPLPVKPVTGPVRAPAAEPPNPTPPQSIVATFEKEIASLLGISL